MLAQLTLVQLSKLKAAMKGTPEVLGPAHIGMSGLLLVLVKQGRIYHALAVLIRS